MRDTLKKALDWIIFIEGGDTITNDPSDPGGLTKYGISKRAYPNLDIKNLTESQSKDIYEADYWVKANCDNIPYPLDLYVFDTAVNCGVARAKQFEQGCSNSSDYLLNRLDYYIEISRKNVALHKFFRGWTIRISKLRKLGGTL